MLIPEVVKRKAIQLVNTFVDIPFLDEKMEESLFNLVWTALEAILEAQLPKNAVQIMNNIADGISVHEAMMVKQSIINATKNKLTIPFFSNEQTNKTIETIADFICYPLVKGVDFNALIK